MSLDNVTYFGETDFRGEKRSFGIKNEDRSRHVYIIGKTGMGKSTVLENMAAQDIQNGEGMCFIDPHGSAIETLIDYIPEHRIKDVIYFAPFDSDYPISFNVMEDVGHDQRHLVVSGLMSAFKKIWVDAWSARMEHILNNTILALLEYPGSTLLGVNRMYADKGFREEVVANVTDPAVRSFWNEEFAKWDERFMREATAAIQNKIGQFTSNPLIRNIVGQEHSSFDFRDAMDTQKIVLVNLSKGRIGEQNAGLLGAMIVTKIYLAAMSRAEVSKKDMYDLPPFFLFVDEFQNFANDSFADILAEARKYKLNLTIAHQYIEQMEESVRDAVFGNVGTTICFRVGPLDAEVMEKIFLPTFTAEDIVNLGKFQTYLTLMIDGVGSKPFSATTLPPIKKKNISYREEVIDSSRRFYAHERSKVESTIYDWHGKLFETAKEKKERLKKEEYVKSKEQKDKIIYGEKGPPQAPAKIKIPEEVINKIKEEKPVSDNNNFSSNNSNKKPNHLRENKNFSAKIPSEKNKSLLKDVLSKALNGATEKTVKEDFARENKPEAKPLENEKKDFIVNEIKKEEVREERSNPVYSNNNKTNKVREVPEDILKKILD